MDHLYYLCLVFVMFSCLVVTCWERADLFALVWDVCIFVTFPCGILWYLIVSIPDLCHLSYFNISLQAVQLLEENIRKSICLALIQCHFDYACSSWYSG